MGFGITAVTDATPRLTPEQVDLLRSAQACGELVQHVTLLGAPLDVDVREPRLWSGPWRIVLADSGLPALDQLVTEIRDRSEERRVGKECVSTCRSRWLPYP